MKTKQDIDILLLTVVLSKAIENNNLNLSINKIKTSDFKKGLNHNKNYYLLA